MKKPVIPPPGHGRPIAVRLAAGFRSALLATAFLLAGRIPAVAQDLQGILVPLGNLTSGSLSVDFQVVGNLGYVAEGEAGFSIVDLTDPTRPRRLGGLDTTGSAQTVRVVGNLAYVADGEAGLQIIDVTDPAVPVRVGGIDTPGLAKDVQVVGNLAYVADRTSGLQIIDVGNPAGPVRLGGIDTPDWAVAVQVVGNLAYVGDDTTGLLVIDVTQPAAPVWVSTTRIKGWVRRLQVVGNLCHVITREGYYSFDVTLPAAPAPVALVDVPGGLEALSVVGRYASVGGVDGLNVFDLDVPTAPRPLLLEPSREPILAVQTVANRVYILTGSRGLTIGDLRLGLLPSLSWPSAFVGPRLALNTPLELGVSASNDLPVTVRVVGPAILGGGVLTVTNYGTVTLIAEQAGDATFLPLRDVRRFNVPSTSFGRLGGFNTQGTAFGVQVVGNIAYVADGEWGLQILDVSDPRAPVRLGGYNTTGTARDVQVAGTLAYVADDVAGLQVIDVSNPALPLRLGGYNSPGSALGVHVVGNLAFMADAEAGLQVIDVSVPSAPVRLGGFDTPDRALDVQVVGNLAYVADQTSGLQIIDVTNPAGPVRLGGIDTPDWAVTVQVVGDLAYVGDDTTGLLVIDVSRPATPVQVSTTAIPRLVRSVQAIGPLCHVANSGGCFVLDISQPAMPVLLGSYSMPATIYGLQVIGNRAYVASGATGLEIIEVGLGQTQELAGVLPEAQAFDGRALSLPFVSSSGLPLTFSVVRGPGSIVNNMLVAGGIGRITVRASQAGDANHLPASLERTITIGLPELQAEAVGNGVDLTWAAGLSGLFLDGRESLASEHSWQTVALPRQEANGEVRVQVESSPFRFFRLRGYTGEVEPLALRGWNRDVILENRTGATARPFDAFGAAWFESGLGGRLDGLPANRTIISRVDPGVVFELQPYTGSNTLWLTRTVRTNVLELARPTACSRLFVLAHSAGGGGNGTLRIHFADGTSSALTPFLAPDWWDGSASNPARRPAINGLARSRVASALVYEPVPPGFSLHQTDIDLSTGPDAGKVITRLEFVKGSTPEVTGIYAVSAIPIPSTQ